MQKEAVQLDRNEKRRQAVKRLFAMAKTDKQLSTLMPDPDLRESMSAEHLTLDRMIDLVLDWYKDRPALGERRYEKKSAPGSSNVVRHYLPAFDEITYGEFQRRIRALSMAWRNDPRCRVAPDEFVAIMGFSGIDFATIDYACVYSQSVTVPVQSALGSRDFKDMMERVEPCVLATCIEDLAFAVERTLEQPSIRTVLVFDYDPDVTEEAEAFQSAQAALKSAERSIEIVALQSLIEDNAASEWSFLPPHPDGGERLNSLIHSSGSTGSPKGAMVVDRATRSQWIGRPLRVPTVAIGLAPLNHGMGRATLANSISSGGTTYFTLKSNMSTLFEDIRLARPTGITFFPRILELVYQNYQGQLAERVRNGVDPDEADKAVREEMSNSFLGDRLMLGTVGGAPTAPAVSQFMEECFGILLTDGYSNTEAGAGTLVMDGVIQRPPVLEYKLRDVPELGYYLTDKPYPRGEFCYKAQSTIAGYYKQPEATSGLFDEDGFVCTGDIAEERGPDQIAIIDRRKDVTKLSQGEYVALGRLGTIYESKSSLIHQIYLYGTPFNSYLLAVIVPEMDLVEKELGAAPKESDIKRLLRSELAKVANIAELKSFEVPRDFIIEKEAFSQENGLLSSVRKRLRPALAAKYGPTLEAIYEDNEKKQTAELEALRDPNSPLSTQEKVTRLLISNLGIEDEEISQDLSFQELGGDSLGAVIFSLAIEEIFAVSIPANDILAPTGNISRWARIIDDYLALGADAQTPYQRVHGDTPEKIHAADLKLSHFIDSEVLSSAKGLKRASVAPQSEHVLITGANGFLGRIACIDWLKKVASGDGQVICLIRAKNDEEAYKRLEKAFAESGDGLLADFHTLSEGKLQVLAGDLSDPDFGLAPETYEALTKTVTRIVHIAALVNHLMHYEHLFKPNVGGVAEIIKFGLTHQIKPTVFVSSASVQQFVEADPESVGGDRLMPTIRLSDTYANGYAASKWAGEVLMHAANEDFGMPVHVFRGDMMLAHRSYKGHVNVDDMFTRLLYSITKTGLAPASFFTPADASVKPTYVGSSVDVVSQVVVECGEVGEEGVATYTISPVGTGFGNSLDDFVDWMIELGCQIERIPDYREWVRRIEQKMNAMDEDEKSKSVLALMSAYSHPRPANRPSAQCANYTSLVKQLNISEDRLQPDKTLIEKYLSDMRLRGLLESPQQTLEDIGA